jgi:hypothetical protein
MVGKAFPIVNVATPLLEECQDDTYTPEMGTWESFGTPKASEFNCRGQNTSPGNIPYIIGKLSKCRCWKWPRMSHLDICSTSYGKKKGQESNWQFDSQPLKVGNRPDPDVCKWNATHRWKALKESYKFALDLIPIGGLSKELWTRKVLGVQTRTISRLLLRSRKTKSHSDVGVVEKCREYYMGKVLASPESRPWWVLWVQGCLWLVLALKVLQNVN